MLTHPSCFPYRVLVIIFAILNGIEPYHQHFSLEDKSLQYPYAVHERVPIWAAVCCSIAAPAVVIVIITLFLDGIFSHSKHLAPIGSWRIGRYTLKERLWQLNCGILGLILAQSLAFVITTAIKNACGRPRPDLLDRCQPYPGSHDRPVYGLSDYTICTQTDKKKLSDGFRSFPSGHSSCMSSLRPFCSSEMLRIYRFGSFLTVIWPVSYSVIRRTILFLPLSRW